MKNLEQIRAKNALDAATGKSFRGANDGEVVKKIPPMIRENGLLGALAFAKENEAKTSHADVFRAIIKHLAGIGAIKQEADLATFIQTLCASDAAHLRALTAEALAYLNYLRRFARKGKEEGENAKSAS